jgi:4-amino-4-deoxy-L-arabinose transferase-like glycosyltransferase
MLLLGSFDLEIKSYSAFLGEHYQFVLVLIACFLVAVSMGTYTNWDAKLEFEATTSILTQGFPYVTTGLMINQPPLGFYTAAAVFAVSGLAYLNGVGLVTAFGLGCVVLVYALGTLLYGRKTGLLAAALFGLVPWHVYLSRIFLIDNQYLFFSLLFIVIGILAVRRNSDKLVLFAGVVFAVALLTKLFAVFALIPIALMIYLNKNEGGFKLSKRKVLIFIVPTLILQALWFGVFANQNFWGVYFSSDFSHPELIDNPIWSFLPVTLVKGTGLFLFAALGLSLALGFAYRDKLGRLLRLDAVCVGTVAVIAGLNLLLVFGFHLTVPYISVLKYNYLALPFLCLIAGSLTDKCKVLLASIEPKKLRGIVKLALVGVGLILLFASLLESVLFLNDWTGFVSFGVDSVTYYGFELFSGAMIDEVLLPLHYGALVLIVGSMFLPWLLGIMHRSLKGLNKALKS